MFVGAQFGSAGLSDLAVAQGTVLICGTALTFGTPQFVMRHGLDAAHAEYLGSAFRLLFLTTLGTAVVAGSAWAAVPMLSETISATKMLAVGIGVFLYVFVRLFADYLRGQGKSSSSVTGEFIVPGLAFMALALSTRDFFGDDTIIIAFGLSWLPAFLLLGLQCGTRKLGKGTPGQILKAYPEIASLLTVQLLNVAMWQSPSVLLFMYGATDTDIAAFFAIQKLCALPLTFSSALASSFGYQFLVAIKAERRSVVRRTVLSAALINGAGSAVILLPVLVAPATMLLLFGLHTPSAAALFGLQILAGALAARQFLGLNELYLSMSGRGSQEAVSAIFAALTWVVITVLLLPPTVPGVCFALACSYLVRSALSLGRTYRAIASIREF